MNNADTDMAQIIAKVELFIEQQLKPLLLAKEQRFKHLNAVFQFDFIDYPEYKIHLDFTKPGFQDWIVRGDHANPNCNLAMHSNDLLQLYQGKLDPRLAFITGKIKVKGDIRLLWRFKSLV